MEPAQLSFLIELVPEPPTVWELLAAGLKANELPPITRADVERAKQAVKARNEP